MTTEVQRSDMAAVVAHAHNTLRRIWEDARGCLKQDTPCIFSLFRIWTTHPALFYEPSVIFFLGPVTGLPLSYLRWFAAAIYRPIPFYSFSLRISSLLQAIHRQL